MVKLEKPERAIVKRRQLRRSSDRLRYWLQIIATTMGCLVSGMSIYGWIVEQLHP